MTSVEEYKKQQQFIGSEPSGHTQANGEASQGIPTPLSVVVAKIRYVSRSV